MQQDILPTTKKVVESAKFVSINKGAIKKFCNSFSLPSSSPSEFSGDEQLTLSQSIGLVCVLNCINFCFWAEKRKTKWATEINGDLIDGATGLFLALKKALKNGVPILDAHFLQNLSRENFDEILNGNIEIPLFEERLKCLHEAGEVLLKHFDGSFMNVLKSADNDSARLANLFIKLFPSFNDFTTFNGAKIEFHKRAQLNAHMINDCLVNNGSRELLNMDKLTIFADYKIPQILRKFGIIEYNSELSEKIDSYVEISAGSREEVEIRSASIWAVEEMKNNLWHKFPQIIASLLDNYLWTLG